MFRQMTSKADRVQCSTSTQTRANTAGRCLMYTTEHARFTMAQHNNFNVITVPAKPGYKKATLVAEKSHP